MRYGLLGCFVAMLAGCGDDDCCSMAHLDAGIDTKPPQDANTTLTEVALIPDEANSELDLLFVVDDSNGTSEIQAKVRDTLPALAEMLRISPGAISAVPSMQVGVVTTDLGTQGVVDAAPGPDIPSAQCWGAGKNGVLQLNGAAVTGSYLIATIDPATNTRNRNYDGELVATLQQMVSAGTSGCSFEQPLEAMYRALTAPANAGFVRPNARLAVVVVSDEDDCSLAHESLLDGEQTGALGPLGSFRCTRFGVTCDGGGADPDHMNVVGTKTECHSNDASPFLTPVRRYTELLSSLKADPRDVLFAAIVAPTQPFNVDTVEYSSGTTETYLAGSCNYAVGTSSWSAAPAVRTSQVAQLVPQGMTLDICDGDMPTQMRMLGQRINGLLGLRTNGVSGSTGCIQQLIDLPASCEAFDIDASGTATFVPDCATTSQRPCIAVERDVLKCRVYPYLSVTVQRTAAPTAGTWTSVRCRT